jgi:hypothetical protein
VVFTFKQLFLKAGQNTCIIHQAANIQHFFRKIVLAQKKAWPMLPQHDGNLDEKEKCGNLHLGNTHKGKVMHEEEENVFKFQSFTTRRYQNGNLHGNMLTLKYTRWILRKSQ